MLLPFKQSCKLFNQNAIDSSKLHKYSPYLTQRTFDTNIFLNPSPFTVFINNFATTISFFPLLIFSLQLSQFDYFDSSFLRNPLVL